MNLKRIIYNIYILIGIILLIGCKVPKEDVIFHEVDVTVWHHDTIYHHLNVESHSTYVPSRDTLEMETEYSRFKAWNQDSTLKGEAINKDVSIPVEVKWKERIVTVDSIREVPVYIDKPVYVDKPVRYIPTIYYLFSGLGILSIIYIILKIWTKIKRR